MSKSKHIIEELKAQVRSLKKKNNHLVKSADNNHNGLVFWKQKAQRLENGVLVIKEWATRNTSPRDKVQELINVINANQK